MAKAHKFILSSPQFPPSSQRMMGREQLISARICVWFFYVPRDSFIKGSATDLTPHHMLGLRTEPGEPAPRCAIASCSECSGAVHVHSHLVNDTTKDVVSQMIGWTSLFQTPLSEQLVKGERDDFCPQWVSSSACCGPGVSFHLALCFLCHILVLTNPFFSSSITLLAVFFSVGLCYSQLL